jgi:hypothetical protein
MNAIPVAFAVSLDGEHSFDPETLVSDGGLTPPFAAIMNSDIPPRAEVTHAS